MDISNMRWHYFWQFVYSGGRASIFYIHLKMNLLVFVFNFCFYYFSFQNIFIICRCGCVHHSAQMDQRVTWRGQFSPSTAWETQGVKSSPQAGGAFTATISLAPNNSAFPQFTPIGEKDQDSATMFSAPKSEAQLSQGLICPMSIDQKEPTSQSSRLLKSCKYKRLFYSTKCVL